MAASFDRLSGGRLLINVVTGGDPVELAGDGIFLDHDARYDVTDEFLSIWAPCRRGRGSGFFRPALERAWGARAFSRHSKAISRSLFWRLVTRRPSRGGEARGCLSHVGRTTRAGARKNREHATAGGGRGKNSAIWHSVACDRSRDRIASLAGGQRPYPVCHGRKHRSRAESLPALRLGRSKPHGQPAQGKARLAGNQSESLGRGWDLSEVARGRHLWVLRRPWPNASRSMPRSASRALSSRAILTWKKPADSRNWFSRSFLSTWKIRVEFPQYVSPFGEIMANQDRPAAALRPR